MMSSENGMTKKRFELKSFHFTNLNGVIYDNLKKEELHLSIYEIVNLLNEVAQTEYDLKQLRDEFFSRFDRVIECDVE